MISIDITKKMVGWNKEDHYFAVELSDLPNRNQVGATVWNKRPITLISPKLEIQ